MSQSNSNTRSDLVVDISFADYAPGDVIPNDVISELNRRIAGTLPASSTDGDAVVSATPPDDTTKIWYISDSAGVPTGEAFKYNTTTNTWESTSPSIPDETCVSTDSDNLMSTDAAGCLKVAEGDVQAFVQEAVPFISQISGNEIEQAGDEGWYVPDPQTPTISTDADNALTVGGDLGWYVAEEDVQVGPFGEIYVTNGTITVGLPEQNTDQPIPFNQAGVDGGIPASIVNEGFVAPSDAVYAVIMTISITAGSNENHQYAIAVDGVAVEKSRVFRRQGTGGDFGSVTTQALLSLSAGAIVSAVAQNAAANDITVYGSMQIIEKT